MCTAISFNSNGHYFGRNLDLEKRYSESVVIVPRMFAFNYRFIEREQSHYAMIGTAYVVDGYPLYYDATNECGLSIAGLNFVGNSFLNSHPINTGMNLAPYELIPFLLGNFKTVEECKNVLKEINLIDEPFNPQLANSELHWIIADGERRITFEYTRLGAEIYDNNVGVLTNNPPFCYQMMNLNNYINLSNKDPENLFAKGFELNIYSRGMGAIGLPGDLSSQSRFVKACYTKLNSVKPKSDLASVGQMFHILGSVEQQEGSVMVGNSFERTQYTSCCDTEKGIYYYRTYENSRISAIDMRKENLDSQDLIEYKMCWEQDVKYVN